MNKLFLLGAAAAAYLYFSKGQAQTAPAAAPVATGGPVFPAANPNATAAIPTGQTIYASNGDVRFWSYQDTNGFMHYVFGLSDIAFITDNASRTMNRRTGQITESDTDHRPTLNPVAININLGSLQDLG